MDQDIQKILEIAPTLYRGPGGAAAVLKDGELVGEHTWGFADLDKRIPMKNTTQMPICSISKQFLCQLLFDLERNPTPAMSKTEGSGDFWSQLSEELSRMLPQELVEQSDGGLMIADLCNMQSGLRDYWALTTLWGAYPDGVFSLADHSALMMERLKSFHFKPGTQFSYCNSNYHLVGRLIEKVTKQSFGNLVTERIFIPAGMSSACLPANTAGHPQPCVGYEGDEHNGYQPAVNRIEWSGDAGIVASLTDMVAYEQYLDRSWKDESSLYRKIAEPQHYRDDSPAGYGWGLGRSMVGGAQVLSHGGALRGYRLHRLHAPEKGVSVVVMLNHEKDAKSMAFHILKKVLNVPADEAPPAITPSADWSGRYLDEEDQMAISVGSGKQSQIVIRYSRHPEIVQLTDETNAKSQGLLASIDGDTLSLKRLEDHAVVTARRLAKPSQTIDGSELLGEYYCAEIDSKLCCCGDSQMLYGWFEGFLGRGPIHSIRHHGEDVWLLADARGMDAPPPGDWTMVFKRDKEGAVVGVSLSCWLARSLEFSRTA